MNTKISKIGFSSIVYFITQVMFLRVGTTQILNSAEIGSIYSVILGSIFSIIIFYFIIKLYNYEKDLTLFEKIEKIYGKNVGKIINLFLFTIFTMFFIYLLWSVNSYVQNKYLDQTPSFIILILFLIPVIWCATINMKAIAKISISVFLVSIFFVLFSISNLISSIDIENFKPFFNTSFFDILKNALVFSAYFSTPAFMIIIVPKNMIHDSRNLTKTVTTFYVLAAINYILIFSFIIGIFGIELSKIFSYPEYSLMKKINVFDFIQRVENIATIQFLYCLFISTVMSLNFMKTYLNHIKKFKKISYSIIIGICLILSLMLFKNTTIGYNIVKKYYIFIYSIPIFTLLIISNIIIKIKKN